MPDLAAILASFGETVAKFNALYENEISLWKVTSIKPNVELGNLAADCRDNKARTGDAPVYRTKTSNGCRARLHLHRMWVRNLIATV